ncbi:hypothetical protein YA0783_25000 [Pseudomonas corrugata]|uniref:TrfB-related DNA-binding protein n=1 Tax=Pseudomonas corrugata TaxID=47879 RepID=UPI0018E5DB2F|nr:TrfB-related DNA-binding protein [Pseudomonas corrugata]MBI6621550.1 hypothetical protein [Pseudomonas corrugata]MBI6694215.1 hypothetical protein [Pseudomonas corrugata]
MTAPRANKKYALTAAQFRAVEPFLRTNKALSEDRIAAARMVMVEGKSYQEAADAFGWSKPNAFSSVKAVWERYQVYVQSLPANISVQSLTADLPRGWERAVLIAPKELMDEFIERAAKAQVEAAAQLRAKIAAEVAHSKDDEET